MNKRNLNTLSVDRLAIVIISAGLLCILGFGAARCMADPTSLTVTGCVYNDSNANGHRDDGESGIAGVVVSNGIQCVLTSENGEYRLPGTDPGRSRFVFVVTPSGYKNCDAFYKRISSESAIFAADFGLMPAPETASPDFSFVQITDLHVPRTSNLAGDLKDIAGMKPSFIVATGDLVDRGSDTRSFETCKSILDDAVVPIRCVIGNHDMPVPNFEEFLGPSYYSFDFGGRHFVVMNYHKDGSRRQYAWFRNDMALQPKDKEVLVFQHYPPNAELMDMLSEYNTKAVFSGHWHSSKVLPYKGITFVNTPSLPYGGIDASPRGYRTVSFLKGKISFDDKFAGCKEHLVIASPAIGSDVPRGQLNIRAGAYDSSSVITKMEYQIDNDPRRQMAQSGKMSWSAWDAVKAPGAHTVKVTCMLDSGAVITKESSFNVTDARFPAPQTEESWPMAGHDIRRTGVTGDTVVPPLYPAWTVWLGGRTHISSPVVAGNVVYVSVSDEECKGMAGLCALDASTGRLKWRFKTDTSVKNSPAADGSAVYIVTVDGNVYAVNAKSGKQMWTYSLGGPLDRWVYSSPIVSDGVVYVGPATNFVALDAKTGNRIWQAKELGTDWISCHISPALGKDTVYFSSNCSNGIFALDRATGNHLWNAKSLRTGHASPMQMGDTLYFPSTSKLHALNPATGDVKWDYFIGGWPLSSPAGRGSTVYVGTNDGRIVALNTSDGSEKWSYQTGKTILFFSPYSADAGSIISSPAVSGDVVYCGSGDGSLYALDTNTGSKLWSYDTGVPITSSPAVSGNTVYICGFDGTVFAFTSNANMKLPDHDAH